MRVKRACPLGPLLVFLYLKLWERCWVIFQSGLKLSCLCCVKCSIKWRNRMRYSSMGAVAVVVARQVTCKVTDMHAPTRRVSPFTEVALFKSFPWSHSSRLQAREGPGRDSNPRSAACCALSVGANLPQTHEQRRPPFRF